ncbi:MAG: hypothetical protein OXB99_17545 [Acidimicrobiaceae bacterium]|nr:hypothetical protein [Acidimicrobiaceae bacterium]
MTATRLQVSSRARHGIFVYVTSVAFILGFQLTGWNPIPNLATALVILALLLILRLRRLIKRRENASQRRSLSLTEQA